MNIPADKRLHLGAGFAASAAGAFLAPILGAIVPFMGTNPALWAISAAFLAGLGKETYDWISNKVSGEHLHDVDPWDLLATVAGGVPLGAFFLLGQW